MTDNDLQLRLDCSERLTVKSLTKTLQSLNKVLKAYGADDLQIMSLHYDYDPTAHREEVKDAP